MADLLVCVLPAGVLPPLAVRTMVPVAAVRVKPAASARNVLPAAPLPWRLMWLLLLLLPRLPAGAVLPLLPLGGVPAWRLPLLLLLGRALLLLPLPAGGVLMLLPLRSLLLTLSLLLILLGPSTGSTGGMARGRLTSDILAAAEALLLGRLVLVFPSPLLGPAAANPTAVCAVPVPLPLLLVIAAGAGLAAPGGSPSAAAGVAGSAADWMLPDSLMRLLAHACSLSAAADAALAATCAAASSAASSAAAALSATGTVSSNTSAAQAEDASALLPAATPAAAAAPAALAVDKLVNATPVNGPRLGLLLCLRPSQLRLLGLCLLALLLLLEVRPGGALTVLMPLPLLLRREPMKSTAASSAAADELPAPARGVVGQESGPTAGATAAADG